MPELSTEIPDVRDAGPARPADTGTRKDIQALRAVAVAAVVGYHLWPGRIQGGFVGVDVFFVISGFLITSHLLRRPPRSGGDLAQFWARRARRLLPASFLVLLTTVVATFAVAPSTMRAATLQQFGAASLYVENWALAALSVDYLGAESAPSPVQHYWSLSVEEQFYLLWPLVLVAVGWFAARRGVRLRGGATAAIAAIVAASFVWSVVATELRPASAYFITPTRIWELGVGALLATVGLRLPPRWRTPAAWAGLLMLAVSVVAYTPALPFPGYTAALPVLGCAVVILADGARTRWSPRWIGDLRPVQWVGDISYSVYLWHWPLIVLAPFVLDRHPGLLDRVGVLVVTLVLASATKVWVEDPFRTGQLSARRTLVAALVVTLLGGAIGFGGSAALEARTAARIEQASDAAHGACFGAAAMASGSGCTVPGDGDPLLGPAEAAEDKPSAYADRCWESPPFTGTAMCHYGVDDAPVRIALIGNSHAGNLLPPLQAIARKEKWSLTTIVASQCPTSTITWRFDTDQDATGCRAWGERVLDEVHGGDFDLVVTSQLTPFAAVGASAAENDDVARRGYSRYLQELVSGDTPVLVMRDMPYPKHSIPSVPDCLAAADSPSACAGKRSVWLPPDPLYDAARGLEDPRVSTVDLSRYTCTESRCPAVIGGVVVYFDASHLTATFSRTLVPYLEPAVLAALRGS